MLAEISFYNVVLRGANLAMNALIPIAIFLMVTKPGA
jgi:hypothetical protein